MIEVTGDLWTYPADVRVITTNGFVKKNGEAVMGRGCALEAKQRFGPYDKDGFRYPGIAMALGKLINTHGNHVHELITRDERDPFYLLSCPVKHNWMEKADINLIERSANELVRWADWERDHFGHTCGVIVMPRPGCGNGQLKWADVKPVIEHILDDRFHVITWS